MGREVTRLVLAWAFDVLGTHRVELQAVANNSRAVNCYLACGFRQEGVRREAELYPDGWKDFIMMGILSSEHAARAWIPGRADARAIGRAVDEKRAREAPFRNNRRSTNAGDADVDA